MISPELQLLLYCAKVDAAENRRTRLLDLLPQISDWETVLNLANHHGLIPLVHLRLKETVWEQLPKEAREALEIGRRNNATQALSMTSELLRLMRLLQQNNIFALPYKGPALSVQLYGDVAMRQYGDLDVVIFKEDWRKVDALLISDGWEIDFNLNPVQEKYFQDGYNVHSYFSSRRNVMLEIHWAFAEPLFSFPFALSSIHTPMSELEVSGVVLPVPVPEDLLFILCFHGTKHKWERLGWLTDIAYLLARYPELDWQRVYDLAASYRLQRALKTMLCLIHSINRVTLLPAIHAEAFSDPVAVSVAKEIEQLIFTHPMEEEGYISDKLYRKMRENWRDRFAYHFYLLLKTIPADWRLISYQLPRGLFFLYYPARLIRLLRKYLLHENI